jgi:hypothetical protein
MHTLSCISVHQRAPRDRRMPSRQRPQVAAHPFLQSVVEQSLLRLPHYIRRFRDNEKDNAENRSRKRPERDPHQTDQKLDGLGIAKRKSGKISEISLTKGDRQVRAKTLLNPSDAFVASLIRVQ